jgi:hypothetical protein
VKTHSAFTKTRQVSTLAAAFFAAATLSVRTLTTLVGDFLALRYFLIASMGATRYGKSAVPLPQPMARVPLLQERSGHELGPSGLEPASLPNTPRVGILVVDSGRAALVFFRRMDEAAPIVRMIFLWLAWTLTCLLSFSFVTSTA